MAHLEPCLARLSRYAHTLVADNEDARDLLADAILCGYEHFERLRDDRAFVGYIFTTLRRLHYKRSRRRRIWGRYDEAQAARIPEPRSAEGETRVDLGILERALLRLPARQRETVVLFEISGLTLEEIRQVQGGSLSGVKSRLIRGRERLAELLREPEPPRTGEPSQAASKIRSERPFERQAVAYLIQEKL